jgi:uncharacterized protein YacL
MKKNLGMFKMILLIYKMVFIVFFGFIGYYNNPVSNLSDFYSAIFGAGFGLFLILFIEKIKKSELKYIWSSFIGILLGTTIGVIFFELFKTIVVSAPFQGYIFFKTFFFVGFPVVGLFVGIQKANMFSPLNIKEFFRGSSVFTDSFLLDTSALIDGRILTVIESGFIEGDFMVAQFVLAELQAIADSHDKNKKIRGKRGLDILDKLRKLLNENISIYNKDISGAKSVDQKLVLLANDLNLKLITNDVNLSKIADLQDVKVLNINALAYALKPIVDPGEHLKITLTTVGKEKNQGIGYLDDGTMVIVENAKNDIGKNLKIEITSVLQTTSGKMLFGKKIR